MTSGTTGSAGTGALSTSSYGLMDLAQDIIDASLTTPAAALRCISAFRRLEIVVGLWQRPPLGEKQLRVVAGQVDHVSDALPREINAIQ